VVDDQINRRKKEVARPSEKDAQGGPFWLLA
jgi:hypothetical protein